MTTLADQTNSDTNPNLCPTLTSLADTPSQHKLAAPLYKAKEKQLISQALNREQQARLLSQAGKNSGAWLQATPCLKVFKIASPVFRCLLQLRLELPLTSTTHMKQCACSEYTRRNYSLGDVHRGHHFATRCGLTQFTSRHNVVRKLRHCTGVQRAAPSRDCGARAPPRQCTQGHSPSRHPVIERGNRW